MIRRAAALALCLIAGPLAAETAGEAALRAADEMRAAIAALETAQGARDRVSALSQTIRAYEDGLASLRDALRQADLRAAALERQLAAQREEVARLTGVLSQIEVRKGPLLLLHPSGPVGTARAGMLLADLIPALQAEVDRLRGELAELAELRALQAAAGEVLTAGLAKAQEARSALSKAISDRTDLPRRFTEDPAALKELLESADTMEAFAGGLALDDRDITRFIDARGTLPLPVRGSILRRPDEADAAGVRRPGLTLSTRPRALVTAPWAGTLRYLGPLLDYGNVMILEPGGGYLLVLAGLETVYGEVGEVIGAGAPLGLMGGGGGDEAGELAEAADFSAQAGGARETETLYLEIRREAEPENPMEWFAADGE